MSRQMGSAHAEQGLGSFPPCPLSHCRWLIPVRDSQLASEESHPAMPSQHHIQVVEKSTCGISEKTH